MIRTAVKEIVELGAFPESHQVSHATIRRQENLIRSITPPVSDEEAVELCKVFGPDDYFGLAWAVLHLIESAPNWPLVECLKDKSNEWILRLRERIERKNPSQLT